MKYDLYCLGSALVDITFQISDDFTKKNEERGISKGAMTLIEKDDQWILRFLLLHKLYNFR